MCKTVTKCLLLQKQNITSPKITTTAVLRRHLNTPTKLASTRAQNLENMVVAQNPPPRKFQRIYGRIYTA